MIGNLFTHLLYIDFARLAGSLFFRMPWQLLRYRCAHFFRPVVTCFHAFCGLSDSFRPPFLPPRSSTPPSMFLNWQVCISNHSQFLSSSVHRSSLVSRTKSHLSSSSPSAATSPSKQYSYSHEYCVSAATQSFDRQASASRRRRLVGFRGLPVSRVPGSGSGPPCFNSEL